MLLLVLACGKDGDHFAPIPDDDTPRAAVVAGTVYDASRKTVADAIVAIEPSVNGVSESVALALASGRSNPQAASTTTRRVTTTDTHGRFAFDRVAQGDYAVQFIADNHRGAFRTIAVPAPSTLADTIIVDVNLTPTGTFSGVATLEHQSSHPAIVVYAQGTSYVAVTDPSGSYSITDVPVGTYTVRASHAGYLDDTESGTLTTAGEVAVLPAMLLRLDTNVPPVATITDATPVTENVPVNFTASGTDVDGFIVLYQWDWEDDGVFDYSSPTTGNASHLFPPGSSYTAKFRVIDNDGAAGTTAIKLTFAPNAAPTATIVSASPTVEGTPVQFVANGNDPDGSIVLYEWDWENDGTYDYNSASSGNASHIYASAGNYTAKFRVTDNDGATDTDTVALVITPAALTPVHMSWRGSDLNPGSAASPVKTLAQAYAIAQANSIDQVLVEDGDYTEVPVFLAGVDVLGGRTWPSWSEGMSHSVFHVGTSRATANSITVATVVRRIEVRTTAAPGNSIALYSSASNSNLEFQECRFIASNAGAGSAGANGASAGLPGGNGTNGGSGSCDGSPPGAGGTGGTSPIGCPGGNGGMGGQECSCSGSPGATGGCVGGSGGNGGGGGDPGGGGQNGGPGLAGNGCPQFPTPVGTAAMDAVVVVAVVAAVREPRLPTTAPATEEEAEEEQVRVAAEAREDNRDTHPLRSCSSTPHRRLWRATFRVDLAAQAVPVAADASVGRVAPVDWAQRFAATRSGGVETADWAERVAGEAAVAAEWAA
jgi:hypothetical protein